MVLFILTKWREPSRSLLHSRQGASNPGLRPMPDFCRVMGLPFAVTRDQSSECCACTNFLKGDFSGMSGAAPRRIGLYGKVNGSHLASRTVTASNTSVTGFWTDSDCADRGRSVELSRT